MNSYGENLMHSLAPHGRAGCCRAQTIENYTVLSCDFLQNAEIPTVLISSLFPLVETTFGDTSCTWKVKDGKDVGMEVSCTKV